MGNRPSQRAARRTRAPVRIPRRPPTPGSAAAAPEAGCEPAVPVAGQRLEALVEQPAALHAGQPDLAERLELAVAVAAEPDAEHQPAPLRWSSVTVSRASL